ncbi:MAG TPA: LLM class F420-dependent oxidoreductase [Nitriliruptorales bacterium]|nr:LLM class F420-dependent oxidoreductase [Nitriliruptorales bacterium]
MRLGLNIGYSGATIGDVLPLVEHADRIGIDSVWAAEAYGSDAVTVLGYLAARTTRIQLGSAILQIPARTPANTAMTAMTLDAVSGGRFILGLGVSGPQVVEGWHGVAYGKPLARTREYVEIVRAAVARETPLTYQGEHYQIPYRGDDATGLGKPLRSILHPLRERIPIYLAALGPRNVELAAGLAEGWLPIFYAPEREDVFAEPLRRGLAQRPPELGDLEIAATVQVALGDDLDDCRDRMRPILSLYVGGMGSRERNFYRDLTARYGFEAEADLIQDLYLAGDRRAAAAAVPDELVDMLTLVGPLPRVIARLEAWRSSRVTTLVLATEDPGALAAIREAL